MVSMAPKNPDTSFPEDLKKLNTGMSELVRQGASAQERVEYMNREMLRILQAHAPDKAARFLKGRKRDQ